MKGAAAAFDAVGGVGAPLAGEGLLRGHQQHYGEIGGKAEGGQPVKLLYKPGIKTARPALIGEGGMSEAVAQHDAPRLKRGKNDIVHMLSPCGLTKQKLADIAKIGCGIKKDAAHHLAYGAAARLACYGDGVARKHKGAGKQVKLSAFAAAVGAFKGYEAAFHRGYRCRGTGVPFVIE